MLKCSRCGYKAKDLGALSRHYHAHHPSAMKHKPKKAVSRTSVNKASVRQVLREEGLI